MSSFLILGSLGSIVLGWLMFILSVFLILLVLVQRGKGGGLTGALGGPGGQSAFGSKAGDTFTLITAVSAIIWGLICAIAMYSLGTPPLTADDEYKDTDDTTVMSSGDDEDVSASPLSPSGGLSGLSELLPDDPAGTDAATPNNQLVPATDTDDAGAGSEGSDAEGSDAEDADTDASGSNADESE